MKTLTFLVIFSTLSLRSSLPCDSGNFEHNGKCLGCSKSCSICDSVQNCLKCLDKFLLYKGSCYPQCDFPRYPFLDDDNQITCSRIDFLRNGSERLIESFDSREKLQSIYLGVSYETIIFEYSMWIKFTDFGESLEEKIFFIISNNFAFHQQLYDMSYIIALGLKGDILIGPTEINNINLRLSKNKWYLISIILENARLNSNIFTGIIVYDFSSEKDIVSSNSKTYLTSEYPGDIIVLHIGNVLNAQEVKFQLKELRNANSKYLFPRLLGTPIMQTNLTFIYDYSQNYSSNISEFFEKSGILSYDIDLEDDFSSILIYCLCKIQTTVFPSAFLRIVQDLTIVYSLEMVLVDGTIMLKMGDFFESLNWNNFDFRLLITRYEDRIVLYDSYNTIMLECCKGLKLEIESSIYSTKFQTFDIIVAKNPSLIRLFENYHSQKIDYVCNIFSENISSYCLFYLHKPCKNNSALNFIYSLNDCDITHRTSCTNLIPNCGICFNSTKCLVCNSKTAYVNGDCLIEIPKDFVIIRDWRVNSKSAIPCNLQESVFENDTCKSCEQIRLDCLGSNSTENCNKIVLAKNCPLFGGDCQIENCEKCKLIENTLSCISCPHGSKVSLGSICNPCPTGYRLINGKCQVFCDKEDEIMYNGVCRQCIHLYGQFDRILCSQFCKHFLSVNKTCINQEEIHTCLQEGPRWCEYCPDFVNLEGCKLRGRAYPLDSDKFENIHTKQFLFKFEYAFICPKNYSINKELLDECHILKTINDENSESRNGQISKNQYFARLCLEYLEGFYMIRVNETCIYVPTSHQFHPNPFIIKNSILISKNEQITYINLTNDPKLQGKILLETLYLEKCPLRFFDDSEGRCQYCGNNCLSCTGKEESLCLLRADVEPEYYDEFFPYRNHFSLVVNEYGWEINLKVSYKRRCPKSCKSCHSTGTKMLCTACVSEEMDVSINENCICRDENSSFDQASLSCVPKCPNNTIQSGRACLKDCTFTPQTMANGLIFNENNECRYICIEGEGIVEIEFDHETKCTPNYFPNKLSMYVQNKKIVKTDSLKQFLIQKGIIMAIDYNMESKYTEFMQEFLEDIFNESKENTDLILQILTVYLSKSHLNSKKSILKYGLSFVDKSITLSQSLNSIWKSHYFYQLLDPEITENNITNLFKYKFISPIDHDEMILIINEYFELRIAGLKNKSSICMVILENSPEEIYISITIRMILITKKLRLSIQSNISTDANLYFANFTSKYMEKISINQHIEIYQGCIYFIMIKKDFINESFYAMVDYNLFFGNGHINEDTTENSQNFPTKVLVLFLICLTALCFVIYKSRNKKPKPSRIKFIQMKNIDSDDEEEEL